MVSRLIASQTTPWLQRRYFALVGAVLLALTLIGFSDNLVTDVGQASNRDPKFIVHGLFSLAWMALFLAQAAIAQRGNIGLHRKLGIASMLVAVGVALSTLYVFVAVWRGWDAMGAEAKANRILMPSYALAVLLAWRARNRSDWHKRFALTATFFMLGPVLSRTYDPLVVSWMEPLLPAMSERMAELAFILYMAFMWGGCFLSLFLYDRAALRRTHPATLAGFIWFLAIWAIVLVV